VVLGRRSDSSLKKEFSSQGPSHLELHGHLKSREVKRQDEGTGGGTIFGNWNDGKSRTWNTSGVKKKKKNRR